MTTTWIKPDWYYPPIDVGSDEQTVVFFEDDGGGAQSAQTTVTAQTYWMIHSFPQTTPASGYPAFFTEVESVLNAASPTGASYEISAAETQTDSVPPSSTSSRPIGIKVVADGGSTDFWWDFSDASFTLPPELLGFPPEYAQTAEPEVVAAGSIRSNFGRWTPIVRREWDGASRKPVPEAQRRTARSDEDRKRSFSLQIDETRYRRRIIYESVGATSIRAGRADLSGYPALDEVAQGEQNNALIDHFDRAADLDKWLVVLDNDDKTLYPETSGGTEKWEHAALDEELDDLSQAYEMSEVNPELYELLIAYEIRESTYDQ